AHRAEAEAQAAAMKLAAQAEAEAIRVKTEAEINALRERERGAEAYSAHPALLRLQELETLRALARTANARIYIGFDKHRAPDSGATRGKKANSSPGLKKKTRGDHGFPVVPASSEFN